MLSTTTEFSLADTGKNVYGKVLEEKFLARQRSRKIEEGAIKKAELKPLVWIFLILSIIAAVLIIAFLLICLCRTMRRSAKWQKTLLIKTSGSGESLTPLIKNPPGKNSKFKEGINFVFASRLRVTSEIRVFFFEGFLNHVPGPLFFSAREIPFCINENRREGPESNPYFQPDIFIPQMFSSDFYASFSFIIFQFKKCLF